MGVVQKKKIRFPKKYTSPPHKVNDYSLTKTKIEKFLKKYFLYFCFLKYWRYLIMTTAGKLNISFMQFKIKVYDKNFWIFVKPY